MITWSKIGLNKNENAAKYLLLVLNDQCVNCRNSAIEELFCHGKECYISPSSHYLLRGEWVQQNIFQLERMEKRKSAT